MACLRAAGKKTVCDSFFPVCVREDCLPLADHDSNPKPLAVLLQVSRGFLGNLGGMRLGRLLENRRRFLLHPGD